MKELKNINRILIVKLSSIGDVVHSLPTLKSLRDTYPSAHIAWVVEEKSKDVILDNPLLDEIIIFEKERWKKTLFKSKNTRDSIKDIFAFSSLLRQKKFDVAIDLQGLLRSSFITFFSGAKIRLGYQDSREFSHIFYNLKIKPASVPQHAVDRYLFVAKFLGADTSRVEFPLFVRDEEKIYAKEIFNSHGIKKEDITVGLNPGASILHNQWRWENFAKLGDILQEKYKAKIILFGGPQDINAAREIYNIMKTKPINLAGLTTIKQLASVISFCNLFVGNDTGPMHIAVAMGVPVVAIFGPADPSRTGPYGKKHKVVYKKLPCAPCFRHPTCTDYKCMNIITVEDVLGRIEELI